MGSTCEDTVDRLQLGVMTGIEGVYLCHLPPRTALLVKTLNSVYRLVITHAPEVSIQGGAFFPQPTSAWVVGSSAVGTSWLKVGWIGIGHRMELRSAEQCIMTSPVRSITTERTAA
jgi:hypothetical protein